MVKATFEEDRTKEIDHPDEQYMKLYAWDDPPEVREGEVYPCSLGGGEILTLPDAYQAQVILFVKADLPDEVIAKTLQMVHKRILGGCLGRFKASYERTQLKMEVNDGKSNL